MIFLLFFLQLVVLLLLSRELTKSLSHMLQQAFHHTVLTIHVLSWLFLPGVIIHELSHLLTASLLFVPTGEIEFLPEVRGQEVKMGSVAIARTDPLRRFLIGVAPLLGGLGIILLASFYLFSSLVSWQSIVLLYIVFQITNTMFSSKKDMEGAVAFGIGVVAIGVVLQVLGVPLVGLFISLSQNAGITSFLLRLMLFLSIAIGIDIVLILCIRGISSFRRF